MQLVDLVVYRAFAEIKKEVASAYFGMTWWVLEPLLYMAAFYLIFALGIRTGGDNFVSFLLCGLVSWKWFASTIVPAASSVLAHRGLIQQIYLPKAIFPLVPVLVNIIKFLVVLLLLIGILVLIGNEPAIAWLYLIPVIIVESLFIVGMSLLLGAIVPFFLDLRTLIQSGIMIAMLLSGIFFDVRDFPEPIRDIFYFNPMVTIIESFRVVLLEGAEPDWSRLGLVLIASLLLSILALVIFWRCDRVYPKVIL